jgi:thiol-disulfide isomerase/thioredoxin
MLSTLRQDCGCGGKENCITKHKKEFKKWVRSQLKKLDCGCGCKGKKAFEKKYGKLIGGKLKECPPGWRNDGLTCVESCNADERDDGLTCRSKCPDGWVDDGLTCRKPITSSMNECPPGSRDIAGTCWGTVSQMCLDDCFKHPAPGCRTYECGRLKGAFGEDWGPKLCTDCNLRCGQTCLPVEGITKQLHERQLKVQGGEVIGQQIRGKKIIGRVDWEETFKDIKKGFEDVLANNPGLAQLFDPEKNGVASAFRKFGDDAKKVFEEVGNRVKDGFEKMGEAAKAEFQRFAERAEKDFKHFGDEFVKKMKDPDFWVEFACIAAQVGAAVLGAMITAGTLGVGAGAGIAIMMAANMAAPAIRMIAKAAKNEPIDALDIADMALAAIPAPGVAGKAASTLIGKAAQTIVANRSTIQQLGGLVITGVKTAQALDLIPSSCIANCPPEPPPPEIPPPDQKEPYPCEPPTKPGEKTPEEIAELQPENTIKYILRNPRRENPDYLTTEEWVDKYRKENYGSPPTKCEGDDSPQAEVPNTGTPQEIPEPKDLEGEEDFDFGDKGEDEEGFDFGGEGEDEFTFGEDGEEEFTFGEDGEEEFKFGEDGEEEFAFGDEEEKDEFAFGDEEKEEEFAFGDEEEKDEFAFGDEEKDEFAFGEEEEKDEFAFGEEEEVEPGEEKEEEFAFGEEEVEEEGELEQFGEEEEEDEEEKEGEEKCDLVLEKIMKMNEQDFGIEFPEGFDDMDMGFQEEDLTGGANDEIEPIVTGNIIENPFGAMASKMPTENIPNTHNGAKFDPLCYARKNPELAEATGTDLGKLTTHWIETGFKEGYDAECGPGTSSAQERLQKLAERQAEEQKLEGEKAACKAADRFWTGTKCDGTKRSNGSTNTIAEECQKNNSYYDYEAYSYYGEGGKEFCNRSKFPDGTRKPVKDLCAATNRAVLKNEKGEDYCVDTENLDGSYKTIADLCADNNSFWTGKQCNFSKDRNGREKKEDPKRDCYELNRMYNDVSKECDPTRMSDGKSAFDTGGPYYKIPSFDESYRRIDERSKYRYENMVYRVLRSKTVRANQLRDWFRNFLNRKFPNSQFLVTPENFSYFKGFKRFQDSLKGSELGDSSLMTDEQLEKVKPIDPEVGDVLLDEGKGISPPDWQNMYKMGGETKGSLLDPTFATTEKLTAWDGTSWKEMSIKDYIGLVEPPRDLKPKGSGKPLTLTLYWAEWCPHCHDLLPIWKQLKLKGVKFQSYEESVSPIKVQAYPTIIFHNGKKMEKYEGKRTKNAILNFLKKKLSNK